MVCVFCIYQYAFIIHCITSCKEDLRGWESRGPAATLSPPPHIEGSSGHFRSRFDSDDDVVGGGDDGGTALQNPLGLQDRRRVGRSCRRKRRWWTGRRHRRNFAGPGSKVGEAGLRVGTGFLGSSTPRWSPWWTGPPTSPCRPGGYAAPLHGSWSSLPAGGRGGVGARFQRGCPRCCSTRRLASGWWSRWTKWWTAAQESDSLAGDLPSWPSPPSTLPLSPQS